VSTDVVWVTGLQPLFVVSLCVNRQYGIDLTCVYTTGAEPNVPSNESTGMRRCYDDIVCVILSRYVAVRLVGGDGHYGRVEVSLGEDAYRMTAQSGSTSIDNA
jgi:hypothetical protein